MKQKKLSTQISLIFLIIVFISVLIIIVTSSFGYRSFYKEQNQAQLQEYFGEVKEYYLIDPNTSQLPVRSAYNGYIIIVDGDITYDYQVDYLDERRTPEKNKQSIVEKFYLDDYDLSKGSIVVKENASRRDVTNYYGEVFKYNAQVYLIIAFTGNLFITTQNTSVGTVLTIILGLMFLLGVMVIYIWSNTVITRISQLKNSVDLMKDTNYTREIPIFGKDEITELSRSIESMRVQIQANEKNKQAVLQNISHDLKTPIAVIKTYAEAIKDGIVDVEDADIIIKQSDILLQKVVQLIELNKLDYLKDVGSFDPISMREVVNDVVNNHRYVNKIIFDVSLDDTKFIGVKQNYNIIISNIVDNALRYAKTRIVFTLKDGVLSIFNDGKPIEQKFIDELFEPYHKGSEGQFGLGMSIVEQTLRYFRMNLEVENIEIDGIHQGVIFRIKK